LFLELLGKLNEAGEVMTAYVSAVGSILVQIAKNVIGCKKVVGIAGGKEKCDWYVE
jgi:NADPH-dependent curcumin reductase CurA